MADEEEEKKKFSAKVISKVFKIVAASGLVLCAVLKWMGFLPGATIGEICMVWAFVYGLGAGTIDINLMCEKFTGKRRAEDER